MALSLQAIGQIRTISTIEADSICQSLPVGTITSEVYDLVGVVVGVNRAEKWATLIPAELDINGEDSFEVYKLANFDSVPFNKREDICIGDTVTIRGRLSNYRGTSTSHYGYLVDLHRFVDPVPALISEAKDRQWRLVMEQERNRMLNKMLVVISTLLVVLVVIILLSVRTIKARGEKDRLSGVYNRYGGKRRINAILASHTPGFFCVFDLDKFRQLNETQGIHVGDDCLAKFGRALRGHFEGHITMRLGGDEFALFYRGTSEEELRHKMSTFFQHISTIRLIDNVEYSISVSVGGTFREGSSLRTFDQLHSIADKGCYESKKVNGSCLTIADK